MDPPPVTLEKLAQVMLAIHADLTRKTELLVAQVTAIQQKQENSEDMLKQLTVTPKRRAEFLHQQRSNVSPLLSSWRGFFLVYGFILFFFLLSEPLLACIAPTNK